MTTHNLVRLEPTKFVHEESNDESSLAPVPNETRNFNKTTLNYKVQYRESPNIFIGREKDMVDDTISAETVPLKRKPNRLGKKKTSKTKKTTKKDKAIKHTSVVEYDEDEGRIVDEKQDNYKEESSLISDDAFFPSNFNEELEYYQFTLEKRAAEHEELMRRDSKDDIHDNTDIMNTKNLGNAPDELAKSLAKDSHYRPAKPGVSNIDTSLQEEVDKHFGFQPFRRKHTVYTSEKKKRPKRDRKFYKQQFVNHQQISDISYLIDSEIDTLTSKQVISLARREKRKKKKKLKKPKLEEVNVTTPTSINSQASSNYWDSNSLDDDVDDLAEIAEKGLPRLSIRDRDRNKKEARKIVIPPIVDEVLQKIGSKPINIPNSKIPEEFHVFDTSPILGKGGALGKTSSSWQKLVFPTTKPSSRVEVVHLAKAFEKMVERVQNQTPINSVAEVDGMIQVADIVGNELVRQVTVHCSERGILLSKLLELLQNSNKQAVQYYQRARRNIELKQNVVDDLLTKIADLGDYINQKNSEVNLFRTEVHELKMKLKVQEANMDKMETEKAGLIKNAEEEYSKRFHVERMSRLIDKPVQTMVDVKRVNLWERKAIEALNDEAKRLSAEKQAFIENQAAKAALEEAVQEKEKALQNIKDQKKKIAKEQGVDEFDMEDDEKYEIDSDLSEPPVVAADQTEDKRVQTEGLIDTLDMEVQTLESSINTVESKAIPLPSVTTSTESSSGTENAPNKRKSTIDPFDALNKWTQTTPVNIRTLEEAKVDEQKLVRALGKVRKAEQIIANGGLAKLQADGTKRIGNRTTTTFKRDSVSNANGKYGDQNQIRSNEAKPNVIKKVVKKRRPGLKKYTEAKLRNLSNDDLFDLYHDLIMSDVKERIYSQKWMHRTILDIFSELTDSDFLASTTDMRNIRKFVYDYHLVKYGLATISVNHLSVLLYNIKVHYKTSSRVRTFMQFCVLSNWFGKQQQDIYTVSSLQMYLKALRITKLMLNKRALIELEEGSLHVSLNFFYNLLDRLHLPLTNVETDRLIKSIEEHSSKKFIYFDDLMILLMVAHHKHEEAHRISTFVSPTTPMASFDNPLHHLVSNQPNSKIEDQNNNQLMIKAEGHVRLSPSIREQQKPMIEVRDTEEIVQQQEKTPRRSPRKSPRKSPRISPQLSPQPSPRPSKNNSSNMLTPRNISEENSDHYSTTITPRNADGEPESDKKPKKRVSISIASFKKVIRNFFGKIYLVKDEVTNDSFVERNPNITRRDLVLTYQQSERLMMEIIDSFPDSNTSRKFKESHTNLYRIVTEIDIDDALLHYRSFVYVLLKEKGDENSIVFANMIQKLLR
mmetsp:Transcript_6338/g.9228  ORF Transcript_6338/g.9228 Transcript_6338/m.9228 type:complete len:1332 (+) Transcript_6338:66-4061(+)